MDEGAGEAVPGGQLVVLSKPGQNDIACEIRLGDAALDRGAQRAIAQEHEMPGVGSSALPIGGVGIEQPDQVLLGDEAAGSEEEARRQPQAPSPHG